MQQPMGHLFKKHFSVRVSQCFYSGGGRGGSNLFFLCQRGACHERTGLRHNKDSLHKVHDSCDIILFSTLLPICST